MLTTQISIYQLFWYFLFSFNKSYIFYRLDITASRLIQKKLHGTSHSTPNYVLYVILRDHIHFILLHVSAKVLSKMN